MSLQTLTTNMNTLLENFIYEQQVHSDHLKNSDSDHLKKSDSDHLKKSDSDHSHPTRLLILVTILNLQLRNSV